MATTPPSNATAQLLYGTVQNLLELCGGVDTEESFRLRQAQMRQEYQQACDAALAGLRGYCNNGSFEDEFIRSMLEM